MKRENRTNLANIITLSRIILSIFLLFIEKNSLIFLSIYSICGLTDILDGYVARKTKTESQFGAKLDTFSDFVFFIIAFIIFYNVFLKYIKLIIIVFLIRQFSIIIIHKKYNEFAMLHTYLNKLAGISLFFIPFFLNFDNSNIIINIIGYICLLSSIEELMINIKSNSLDLNKKSIFI